MSCTALDEDALPALTNLMLLLLLLLGSRFQLPFVFVLLPPRPLPALPLLLVSPM